MMKIIWEVQYLSLPPVIRYCKKCGRKMEFVCSGQFRVNAQRRYLDIWLIYKCSSCETTWNAAVYSRISPQALSAELLDKFHENDKELAKQYAMNGAFLHENGAEAGLPEYSVSGESFSLDEEIELTIKSEYDIPIKVSSIVRDKLNLSRREYTQMVLEGKIRGVSGEDLGKCRVRRGIVLRFGVICSLLSRQVR